jgi:hypothetical protein
MTLILASSKASSLNESIAHAHIVVQKCQFRLVRLAFDGEEISLSVVGKLPLVVGVLWTCCFACVSV